MFLLKVLDSHNRSIYIGAPWSVPDADGTPTKWRRLKVDKFDIRLCQRGYHGWADATAYYYEHGFNTGHRLYLMEVRGVMEKGISKVAASQARLVRYLGQFIYDNSFENARTPYIFLTAENEKLSAFRNKSNQTESDVEYYINSIITEANEGNP